MNIYAKVGTHAGQVIHVVRKRKPPVSGDYIHFKIPMGRTPLRNLKPQRAIVREIKDVGRPLYYLELI